MSFNKLGLTAYAFLALAFMLSVVSGCGGGGGGTGPSSPLSLQNVVVTVPSDVSEGIGGSVTVSADAVSPYTIDYVKATLKSSDSSEADRTIDLTPVGGARYSGTFIMQPFQASTEQTKTYTVLIDARDVQGNTASTTRTFQVTSTPPPPPPPPSQP